MTVASIPSPSTAVWHLGPIPIRAYALCIVAGIVVACAVTEMRMRRRGAPPYLVLDVAVWAVPFGIVGARLYHVISSPEAYFGKGGNPWKAFVIWEGGLGIWGAVAAGALGAWIGCRRMGVPLGLFADAAAPGLPLAQAVGRFGNWFNNELFGGHTDLPWGLKVHEMDQDNPGHAKLDSDGNPLLLDGGPFHPAFLYEAVWDVGVAILVILLDRRYRFGKGRAFALYVMAYTLGRTWIEAMRTDTATHILGQRINVWVSILVFLGALVYFVRVRGPRELIVQRGDKLLVVPEGDTPYVPAEGAVPADDEADAALTKDDSGGTEDGGTEDGGTPAKDDPGGSVAETDEPTGDETGSADKPGGTGEKAGSDRTS